MAVVAKSQPNRIPDLLGYRSITIEEHLENGGYSWIGYDDRLRLNAAANSLATWAHIDTTLWHLVFTGKAKSDRDTLSTPLIGLPLPTQMILVWPLLLLLE